jgi:hypothetical protein
MVYNYYVFGHYPSSRLCLKCRPVYISKHKVSETGFCLRLQVNPTQLGSINRASPYLRTVDNIQEHINCTKLPSSQIFRSMNGVV